MHFFQKFRVHFVATNLEMKSGLFTSGSYRRASVGLTDNQLGMSQNHQSHPIRWIYHTHARSHQIITALAGCVVSAWSCKPKDGSPRKGRATPLPTSPGDHRPPSPLSARPRSFSPAARYPHGLPAAPTVPRALWKRV